MKVCEVENSKFQIEEGIEKRKRKRVKTAEKNGGKRKEGEEERYEKKAGDGAIEEAEGKVPAGAKRAKKDEKARAVKDAPGQEAKKEAREKGTESEAANESHKVYRDFLKQRKNGERVKYLYRYSTQW